MLKAKIAVWPSARETSTNKTISVLYSLNRLKTVCKLLLSDQVTVIRGKKKKEE